ncbi:MAG: trypsin-like serine protease [Myxococcota bacterium]
MTWWIASVALAGPGLEPLTPVVTVDVDPASIVGGEPTAPGDAPAVGALFVSSLYGCTGVLIAPDLVLSAGHCWSATSLEKSVVIGTSDHDGDEG